MTGILEVVVGGAVPGILEVVVGGGVTVSLLVVGGSVVDGTAVVDGGTVVVAAVVGEDVGKTFISVASTVGEGTLFTVDETASVGANTSGVGSWSVGGGVGGALSSRVARAASAGSSVAFGGPDEGLAVGGVKPPIVRPILRVSTALAARASLRARSSAVAAILSSVHETNS